MKYDYEFNNNYYYLYEKNKQKWLFNMYRIIISIIIL